MYEHVLFDLDGTLTDPHVGIVESFRFALQKCGQTVPDASALNWVIGPPLRESFIKLVPDATSDLVQQMVAAYRERYAPIGMFENHVYSGVPDMLQTLTSHGIACYVATSKAHVYAKKILAHFNLDSYFRGIHGSELDGTRERKGEVIASVLSEHGLHPGKCVMIGDREHDILGATENNMTAIGVSYGFGCLSELTTAGARYVAQSPREIVHLIMTDTERFQIPRESSDSYSVTKPPKHN